MIFNEVTSALFGKLLAGKIAAGNANKLGGKVASEYALASQLFSKHYSYDGLDFNTLTATKIYCSGGTPGQSGATNYPDDTTGVLIVIAAYPTIRQTYVTYSGSVYERAKYSGFDYWSEWKKTATTADLANYLPLSGGGNIDGHIRLIASTAIQRALVFANSLRNVHIAVNNDGSFSAYCNTNGGNIFRAEKNGVNTWYGTATGNLPLTGGTVNGAITAKTNDFYPLRAIRTDDDRCYTAYSGLSGALGRLGFSAVNTPAYMDIYGIEYNLLHTGNSTKVVFTESDTTAPSDSTALWAHL